MKTLNRIALIVVTLGCVPLSHALLITPAFAPQIQSGSTANPSDATVSGIVGATVTLQYKSDTAGVALGNDSGPFAASYNTTMTNPVGDPGDADIDWLGGALPFITGNPIWLFVKDGMQGGPASYYFNITGWDGKEAIDIRGFWPDQGAISHIAIYSGTGSVPDGGTTMLLLGAALAGLGFVRRQLAA